MTRTAGIVIMAASIAAASTATQEGVAQAFFTVVRAPATLCQTINGSATTPGNAQIQTTEANVGRFVLTGGSLKMYCPTIDLPTVLDLTSTDVADRVSILYSKTNNSVVATAQLCSEDNLPWSIGGSCDNAATSQVSAGISTIELTMSAQTNWQVNPSSLHYIYVYIPGFKGAFGSGMVWDQEFFSGYTIWHS
jgi:hypothetical protein